MFFGVRRFTAPQSSSRQDSQPSLAASIQSTNQIFNRSFEIKSCAGLQR
jgi:hypothetical protein